MKKSPIVNIVLFGCLLGIILVVVFGRPSAVDDATRVVVTAGDIAQLRAGWMRTWQREPTPVEELKKFGLDSLTFDPCGNVPETGDYLSVMRENVRNLKKAFSR